MPRPLLLKIIAVLWVIWGAVHMLAGVLTLAADTAGKIAGIADAVPPEVLQMDYHPAVGALINQHGFNLFWIGAITTIGGALIWRGSVLAIYASGVVGGLADVGYFLFMDLGGFVNFLPGTLMTLVSGGAIVLSALVLFGPGAPVQSTKTT
ncbi:MAG: hypothetical protein AAFU49_00645 [Pseudomonadota bacterium]